MQVVLLLIHLNCLTLCLLGESGSGPASTSAQSGQSIHATTWAPGHSKVLPPLGLMGEGTALPRDSWWSGAALRLELRSTGAFLSLCLDGNRHLGTGRSSEKEEEKGLGGGGPKLSLSEFPWMTLFSRNEPQMYLIQVFDIDNERTLEF